MIFQIKTINGQKTIVPLTADTGTGAPVGSLISMYKKSSPSGYLYCDGSTFDQTKYPALYQYLGSNVLPDYREFALVGAEENTTDVYNASTNPTGTIHDHDVYTEGQAKDDQVQDHTHSAYFQGGYDNMASNSGGEYVVHPNDANTGNVTGARAGTVTRGKRKAVYFYIKATSGLTENQQENVLNTINENLSYSTTEHKTGKKWIDGKPIYSITVVQTAFGSSVNAVPLNVDKITKLEGLINSHGGTNYSTPYYQTSSDYWNFYVTGRDIYSRGQGVVPETISITIEYTKTTD